jgi:hypothetical protein
MQDLLDTALTRSLEKRNNPTGTAAKKGLTK